MTSPPPSLQPAPPGAATCWVEVPADLMPAVERLMASRAATGAPSRRPITDVPLTIALAAVAAALTFVTTVVVPRFKGVLYDFGIKLPTATQLMLDVSDFMTRDYGWVWTWLIVLVVPALWAHIGPARPRGRSTSGLVVLTILAVAAIIVLTVITLYLPTIKFIENISGPDKNH